MPSMENMMNVQVKLEPLPQSVLQEGHGSINLANGTEPPLQQPSTVEQPKVEQPKAKKRGRPKKTENRSAVPNSQAQVKQEPMENKEPTLSLPPCPAIPGQITSLLPVRKKRERFGGMTEEEVLKRTLPDHITPGLDIVIVGINPGLCAAYHGHFYAGPGNHFWKCLYLSGFIPEPMKAIDDVRLKDYGIGLTSIVARTSKGSADLSRNEIKEGAEILKEKVKKFKPRIVVFNGKGIYEIFSGNKKFHFGKQPEHFPDCEETLMFVMPSSSARCTQLPRAADKVPFYLGLKKLRDYLKGDLEKIDDSEVTFPEIVLKTAPSIEAKVEEKIGGKAPTKKLRKKAEKVKLSGQHHDLIAQALGQFQQDDGPIMSSPPVSAGVLMPGMFPPPSNQPQMPQQPHYQNEQPGVKLGDGSFSMPPHSSWGNIHPGMMGDQGSPSPRNQESSGMGQDFKPQNWESAPQPVHSQPASQQTPQQQQPAMTPSWLASAPPMPGGSLWMPPHQQYMNSQMHGGQPPQYPYGGQYGAGGPNLQGQPFPYSGLPAHATQNGQEQDSGMNDPKVKEEPKWS